MRTISSNSRILSVSQKGTRIKARKGWSLWLAIVALIALVLLETGCAPPSAQKNISTELSDSTAGIIGGSQVAASDELQQSLVLLYDVASGSICTGNIISEDLVLTAAHCATGRATNMLVVFALDIETATKDNVVAVKKMVIHPLHLRSRMQQKDTYDIAVIKLAGKIKPGYRAIGLQKSQRDLVDRMNVTLAGYGIDDGVKKTGAGLLRRVDVPLQSARFGLSEMLTDETQHRGSCHGDSGGALYVSGKTPDSLVLAGITSRGYLDFNDDCSTYGVFTSVAYHLNWIAKTANQLSPPVTSRALATLDQ